VTLAVAWLRNVNATQELLIASDSRLRFGCAWDCCPKIIALPRGDAALCFAGNTAYAYPVMLQLRAAVEQHRGLLSRAIDLEGLKGHFLRVINDMVGSIHDAPSSGLPEPDAVLLLAGYSWRSNEFRIWLLHYDPSIERFTFRPASEWRTVAEQRLLIFVGDHTDIAKEHLVSVLKERGKLESGGLDMEPFEVLRDMIRSGNHPTIGGAPQLLKVHRHLNATPYAVWWPKKGDGLSLLGRPLLNYERTQSPTVDPDTLEVGKTWDYVDEERGEAG
jgi:hypothetical protein